MTMAELRIVPHTTWVSVRGRHPGGLVEIRRVTERAVYYRVIRVGASSGPRPRTSGSLKTRFDRDQFLRNYRPNSKRDWLLAGAGELVPEGIKDVPTTPESNGRLHPDEVAIAAAIRSGAKYHDVQRDYHVHGRVLREIIEKYEVPYVTTRQIPPTARAVGEPETPTPEALAELTRPLPEEQPEQLHPQEDEIVELMRSRAASFQEVLRTYHVKSTVLVEIMARHDIPKQTEEEKRAKARAYYHQQKARLAEEASKALADAATVVPPTLQNVGEAEPLPEPSSKALAEMPEVDMRGARRGHYAGAHQWQVTMRTTVVKTFQAISYLDAAEVALETNPGAEILGLVRIETDDSA